jgi:hypothetical protein
VAQALGEKGKLPQHQIKRIVQVCGTQQAQDWLKEVQAIEAQGGMLTSDGSQRRTPGGVYFKLVRSRLIEMGQKEKMQHIFRGKQLAGSMPRKQGRPVRRPSSGPSGGPSGGPSRSDRPDRPTRSRNDVPRRRQEKR